MRSPSMIETTGLTHSYGGQQILKGLSLSIGRGEVFAIIGPTGAGKTTLLRILDLLEVPDSGQIRFDGQRVPSSGGERLRIRRRMSFIHQKPQVFNSSVYDNVACGLRWRGEDKDRIAEKVAHMLEMVGLEGYSSRNARTLSGGEAQRVALARSLILEPELLLLDEPTANLDPVSTAKIEQLIAHVARQRNTTMVMATHDMAQGQQLADRMGVLLDGRLAQTGNSTDIFRSPRNREVASFIGMENIVAGTITISSEGMVTVSIAADPDGPGIQAVSDYPEGKDVYACIRPEDITLTPVSHRSSARNSFQGTVTRLSSLGPLCKIGLDCGFPLVALITRVSAEELALRTRSQVHAAFKATAVHVMDRSTDR